MKCASCENDVDKNPSDAHWVEEIRQTICGDCHRKRQGDSSMTDEKKSKGKGRPKNRWYLCEVTDEGHTLIIMGPIGSKTMLIDDMTPEQQTDTLAGRYQIKRGYLEDDPIRLA